MYIYSPVGEGNKHTNCPPAEKKLSLSLFLRVPDPGCHSVFRPAPRAAGEATAGGGLSQPPEPGAQPQASGAAGTAALVAPEQTQLLGQGEFAGSPLS